MFKKGDIVRNKNVEHLVARIKKVTKTEYILSNSYVHSINDGCLELWKPIKGELVILKENTPNGIQFIIKKFDNKVYNDNFIEPLITYKFNNLYDIFKV